MGEEVRAQGRRLAGGLVDGGGARAWIARGGEERNAVARSRRCDQDGRAGNDRRARRQAENSQRLQVRQSVVHRTINGQTGRRLHKPASTFCKPGGERREGYIRTMESPPKVGWTGRHAVELYVRTYTTMLQSSGDIKIESLVQAHLGMGSVLHPLAAEPQTDMGALLYAVRRLPEAISRSRHVVMGQSRQGFRAVLGEDIMGWAAVKAPARRRRWYHDGKDTLAVLIASTSDIDDLVPTLVAYQIEWNKLHHLLQDIELDDEQARQAAGATEDDWRRLPDAGGDSFDVNLAAIKREECRIVLRLIGGSHLGYARNASRWWLPIASAMGEMGARDAPIYFVSSNSHSLVNVLTGVARQFESEIVDWVGKQHPELDEERRKLEAGHIRASRDNWLYYGARHVFDQHPD